MTKNETRDEAIARIIKRVAKQAKHNLEQRPHLIAEEAAAVVKKCDLDKEINQNLAKAVRKIADEAHNSMMQLQNSVDIKINAHKLKSTVA